MAESKSPSLPRSPHKLEYPSSIRTTLTSTALQPLCHSSFDFISQPRDCQALNTMHQDNDQPPARPLARDLRRVDADVDSCTIDVPRMMLERTESIAPAAVLDEQTPSSHPHTYSQLLSLKNTMENNGTMDDEGRSSVQSPSDYMAAAPSYDLYRNLADEALSHSRTTLRPTASTSSTSSSSTMSSSDAHPSITFGVDWSERARPTCHCWFPHKNNDATSPDTCAFSSCKDPKSNHADGFVQCEPCSLVVHTHHLLDSSTTTTTTNADNLPPCRPSFSESQHQANDHDRNAPRLQDQHYWSPVSMLTKPCALCRRKSTATSLFGSGRPSTMPSLEVTPKGSKTSLCTAPSPRALGTSGGYRCSWCSRSYHARCWSQVSEQSDKNKCDYGALRNVIVRPQWLRRIPGPPAHFRAQYRFHSDDNSSTSTEHYKPLLLFINKRSGGQSGEKIYRKLLHLLNPRQVFLLENDATILHALEIYSTLTNIRICVFGGDGTVGWVLGRLAELYPSLNNPPVSICPLGTGNDLSRVLLWGEQFDSKRLLATLTEIPHAQSIALDRWQVSMEQLDRDASKETASAGRTFLPLISHPKFVRDTNRASYQNNRELPNTRFINYMSFGLDAAIALEFHDRRKRDPAKFSSPLKNKLMYLNESRKYIQDFARSKQWNLGSYIRLICDGENFTDSIRNCHTLLVLNIPGYASGTNPWGKNSTSTSTQSVVIQKDSDSLERISTSSVEIIDLPANAHEVYELVTLNDCSTDPNSIATFTTVNASGARFDRQDFGDKKIEVVGLSTTNMAMIHMGFRGTRLAQCSQLRIEICCPMTAQMDGEPFYLPESVAVNITHAGQVLVLRNESR